jgi:hypothetical protein
MWVFVYGLTIYLPAADRPTGALARRTGGITLWR